MGRFAADELSVMGHECMMKDSYAIVSPEAFQQAFDDALRSFWDEVGGRFSAESSAESVFYDLTEFVQRPGKRLRPWLFVEFYRYFSGVDKWDSAGVMRVAIALELLHAFILAHDDIVDRAVARRGLPPLQEVLSKHFGKHKESARHGQNLALIGGDILFALAYEALLESGFSAEKKIDALRYFSSSVTETGAGEVMEIYFAAKEIEGVALQTVEKIYDFKTTRYTFIMPMRLAGILSGAEEAEMEKLQAVLIPLGLVFQIENDLQDFRRLEKGMLGSDLTEGRKTLLLCMAYEALNEVDCTLLQLCLSDATHHESSVSRIVGLIRKSGALARIQARQRELLLESERSLHEMEAQNLRVLILGIAERMGLRALADGMQMNCNRA